AGDRPGRGVPAGRGGLGMRIPLRLRLTAVFALGMALVLAGLGAFLYVRLASDITGSIDLGLRSRAQVLVDGMAGGAAPGVGSTGALVDADESFAQVLDREGRVLRSSSRAAATPLLPGPELAGVSGPT